jgi:SAM-dependent methyltransferase
MSSSMNDYYAFDEDWYRQKYADVQAAISEGIYTSGRDHFDKYGAEEGRFPCAVAEEDRHMGRGAYADAGDDALSDTDRQAQVGDLWSTPAEEVAGWYWMAHPMVRERLNKLASGDPSVDSYGRLADLLDERGVELPIKRAVSLGCGFGGLERDLAARGIIEEIDAYDIAPGAIAEAQRLAQEAGFDGLRYHVADLETEPFARDAVDVVFAHQSVHHVARLDELFTTVAAMLKPNGVFHLHEFVGPDRFQWTDQQIAGVNQFLDGLPPRLRALPSGMARRPQGRATIAAMIAADPSEAVRSSAILPVLQDYFDILEHRPLGGALLHLGLADIAQNFDPASAEDRGVLQAFFDAEDTAMSNGIVGSDFAVITAIKRGRTSSS